MPPTGCAIGTLRPFWETSKGAWRRCAVLSMRARMYDLEYAAIREDRQAPDHELTGIVLLLSVRGSVALGTRRIALVEVRSLRPSRPVRSASRPRPECPARRVRRCQQRFRSTAYADRVDHRCTGLWGQLQPTTHQNMCPNGFHRDHLQRMDARLRLRERLAVPLNCHHTPSEWIVRIATAPG